MIEDSTTRFSSRVGNYVRYRPGYPFVIASLLTRECHLKPGAHIVDIGSGTGLLSSVFLNAGFRVTGIEPNREMRLAGSEAMAGFPGFSSVDGQAEATGLPDASVDLCVAGQAFHWFDAEASRNEWRRILRPGGFAALIWNERRAIEPLMDEVRELLARHATEPERASPDSAAGRERLLRFFAPSPMHEARLPNEQQLDLAAFSGRIFSSSYMPLEADPRAWALRAELTSIFDRHQREGRIRFLYTTHVYWGLLS